MGEPVNIAVIGAGLAGLHLANALSEVAHVQVFDKARGVGGRMSTRYTEHSQFDHGAPFFIARSQTFKDFLQPWIDQGVVQPWQPRVVTLGDTKKQYTRDWFEPHFVGAPKMNALCKRLAEAIDLSLGVEITAVHRAAEQWQLSDQTGQTHGPFDWVLCTAPMPQSIVLLGEHLPFAVDAIQVAERFVLLLDFERPLKVNWQVARVKASPIEWVIQESSKPGRPQTNAWTIQSSAQWAQDHLEQAQAELTPLLMSELERLLKLPLPSTRYGQLHRWRYACAVVDFESPFFLSQQHLGVCGDGFLSGDVESAFLSAQHMGARVRSRLLNDC